MKEILWSEDASNDFIEIVTYTKNKFGIKIAKEASDRILSTIEKVLTFPNHGKTVNELNKIGIKQIKELQQSPWRIFYRIDNEIIYIISIIDGRRNIEELLYKKVIDGKL
jgi:toxin ParE1/3/4